MCPFIINCLLQEGTENVFEIFRLREKDIPVENFEIKSKRQRIFHYWIRMNFEGHFVISKNNLTAVRKKISMI